MNMALPEPEISKAARLHEIFSYALFRDSELNGGGPPPEAIEVEGVVQRFGFHGGRLMEKHGAIRAILREVVTDDFLGTEGGYSFLALCNDRDGQQWAEHPTMEKLVVLALGLGWAIPLLPRKMWPHLPGGVPYYRFNLDVEPKLWRKPEIDTKPDAFPEKLELFGAWKAHPSKSHIKLSFWQVFRAEPEEASLLSDDDMIWALVNADVDPLDPWP